MINIKEDLWQPDQISHISYLGERNWGYADSPKMVYVVAIYPIYLNKYYEPFKYDFPTEQEAMKEYRRLAVDWATQCERLGIG